jgi:hypothetical protein
VKIKYETIKFSAPHLTVIGQAQDIVREYLGQGYDLTLRQLYYQFVSRDFIENTQQSYKRLGDIINRARLAGMLDWSAIVDRTRNLAGTSHWEQPGDVIRSAAAGFRLDKWDDQPRRVEIWVEKEALAGVVGRVAYQRDLDYFCCRGYVSQSEAWSAARRLGGYLQNGQAVTILHLGDHDPSGIDMTRDITDRIQHMINVDWVNQSRGLGDVDSFDPDEVRDDIAGTIGLDRPLEIRRIALNFDQVRRYNPPPNPAKMTDSRAEGYVQRYGRQSWELDALPPQTLAALINEHVDEIIDQDRYDALEADEEHHRTLLAGASRRWHEVVDFLAGA